MALASPVLTNAAVVQFYISPDGDDANPGSIDLPFATLHRAQAAVRSRLAGEIDDDVWVYLRDGVYRIESPVEFGIVDSPPPGRIVHYAAYPGERPVISGGRAIDGWTEQADGTWTTIVPGVVAGEWAFRELFVNGRRRQRARHPNSGFLNAAGPNPAPGADARHTFAFYPGDLPADTDLAGAELNMLHEWTTSRVRISSIDPLAHTLTTSEPIGATGIINSIFQTTDHPRYAVENHPALLDAPGEWYLDRATGVLTYRPMPGEFVESVEAIAPIATALVVVRGDFSDGTPVRNLSFENLAFEHCAWALPTGGYSTYQSGYYEPRVSGVEYELPAAIKFEVAENCRLFRSRVSHCGGWGVMLGAWCRDCSLIGSIVTDIAGNGVIVGEDQYRRVNGIFWVNGHWEQVAVGNQVVSNLVQDCGVELQDCAGIWAGLTDTSTIASNIVRRLPHIGISTGGFWNDNVSPCREILILDNRVEDVVTLLSDGGAVYSVGLQPDSRISGNLISGIPLPPGLSRNVGIYLDQGSTGFSIQDNGIFDIASSAFKFHWAGENQLIGNTIRMQSSTVDVYYFQSTALEDIVRIGDVVILPGESPAGCAYPVCGEAASAGLLAEHVASIYFDRDGDGVADLDDWCVERRTGDVNGDGSVNGLDIESFVQVLLGETTSSHAYCAADANSDRVVSVNDVAAFVSSVLSLP
ncbi:MAG: hypothetical protein H6819_06335 [Phycisphaerales bacterium]|nr:hypothetical protein [Phycisphaerales bacterium]MCB9858561.1 hypothetical protein [Phycisphaerales bacterium]